MPKSSINRRPVDVKAMINKGGSAPASEDEIDDSRVQVFNLRMPWSVYKKIDALRAKSPVWISRNTWIAMAIEDKLEIDGAETEYEKCQYLY